MKSSLRKPLWITALVGMVIAIVFASFTLFAGAKTPAMAAEGCGGMQHGATQFGQDHSIMGDGDEGCPMSKDGGMMGMHGGGNACAMLTGKIASIDRDGTITVRVRSTENTPAAARKAISELKAGDSVSVMMMLGKAQPGASTSTTNKVAKYACPMHPEVTSDKPGECPKCGMNLEPVKPQGK